MMRFLLSFVFLAHLLACLVQVAPAQTYTPPETSIKIGSWNLEFLGADPKFRRDTPPRAPEDLAAIGNKIRELGVSVLGVQEICGAGVLDQVAEATGPTWRAVLGTTGQWDDGKTQQGVGFLYDSGVLQLVHAEEFLDFPRQREDVSVFHRKPVTACLRHRSAGFDFRIVVVHLKAGRKARDLNKRRVEAKTLREWVDKLRAKPGEDQDIVILGDFNCSYGDEPERVLEAGSVMQYLDQQAPTIMHFDTPIDQVCVAKGFAEVRRDSMKSHAVMGEAERLQFRKIYSDHFPITVRLRARADDDPNATFSRGPAAQVLPTNRRPRGAVVAAAASWPPPVGTKVQVLTISRQMHTGKLLKPLPREAGWVVLEGQDGILAFPMKQVQWARVAQ